MYFGARLAWLAVLRALNRIVDLDAVLIRRIAGGIVGVRTLRPNDALVGKRSISSISHGAQTGSATRLFLLSPAKKPASCEAGFLFVLAAGWKPAVRLVA